MKFKKWLSSFLVLSLIVGMFSSLQLNAFASEEVTVSLDEEEVLEYTSMTAYASNSASSTEELVEDFQYFEETYGEAISAIVSAVESFSSSVSLSSYSISTSEFSDVMNYVYYNELCYYLSGYSYNYNRQTGYVSTLALTYSMDESTVTEAQAIIEAETATIVEEALQFSTEVEQMLYVHDWLVGNLDYDSSGHNNVYGAFVDNSTMCVGYATSFYYILNLMGIDCYLVISDELGHMWNLVYLDGELYYVDCTFDDPTYSSLNLAQGILSGQYRYSNFLVSDDVLYDNSHATTDWTVNGVDIYTCASDTYDSFFWQDISTSATYQITYSNGYWYYQLSTRSGSSVYMQLYEVEFLSNTEYTVTEVVNVASKWVYSSGSYTAFYTNFQTIGDFLYYRTNDGIYLYVQDGDDILVFENTSDENIFDFVINDDYTFTVVYGDKKTDDGTYETYNLADYFCAAQGHDYVTTEYADATCTEDGYASGVCSICGGDYAETISALGHDYVVTESVDATCTEDGYTTYTCSVCDDSYTETISATGHTAGDAVTENEVEATCGTAGSYDTVVYCTVCGEELSRETTTVAATGEHSYVKSDDGAGTITYTCSVCGDSYTETYEVADTVTITTIAAEGTTISINGTEVGTATTEVEAGSTYTVTTTGAAGIIVETTYVAATSYTAVATGAATYTTVADTSADDITITFVDEFGNLVATWTADDAAAATALPDAYEFVNVTFDGWSATLEEVQAATESMVVTGTYSTTAMSLTVTADGATIAVYDGDDNATEYSDTATVSYYSTKVTVSADDATVWYVNGSAVGYGSSYTFYVGADVTLTYGTDVVSPSTVVTAVNVTSGSECKAIFLASRSVADGDTLVESGWVYGKDMAEDDLVLENVGTTAGSSNGTVKKAVNQSTSSEAQFALSYGISAMSGSAVARAFVTYTANGETVTVYSSALTYTY